MVSKRDKGKFVDISVLGDKELQAKLRKLPLRVQNSVMKKAMRRSGKAVLRAAKARAPVLTGRLRKSLHLRINRNRRGDFSAKIQTRKRNYFDIPDSSRFFYPAIVEYKQKPYLRPAIDSNRQAFVRGVGSEMRKLIASMKA